MFFLLFLLNTILSNLDPKDQIGLKILVVDDIWGKPWSRQEWHLVLLKGGQQATKVQKTAQGVQHSDRSFDTIGAQFNVSVQDILGGGSRTQICLVWLTAGSAPSPDHPVVVANGEPMWGALDYHCVCASPCNVCGWFCVVLIGVVVVGIVVISVVVVRVVVIGLVVVGVVSKSVVIASVVVIGAKIAAAVLLLLRTVGQ